MELLHFHTLRTAVQENAFPGSGADLALREQALRDLLVNSGMFESVEVERTEDPDRLLIALCRFRTTWSEEAVAGYVERLWDEQIRHPFWEAHSLIVDVDHVELEGATRSGQTGSYLTLHLVAQRATVPSQRRPAD